MRRNVSCVSASYQNIAIFLALFSSAVVASPAQGNADPKDSIHVSVYPTGNHALDPSPIFSARASELELKILSAEPFHNARPILLLADPNSYGRAEMRRRISVLGRAFAIACETRGRPLKIRMGIPVLDGILGVWLTDPKTLVQDLDRMIESYLPDRADGDQINPGRTIDLLASLVRKAQDDGGPVDALLLAKDRRYTGEEASYFVTSVQRQFLDVCIRKGSTLYGYLSGGGLFQEVCISSGGLVFLDNQPAELIAQKIIEQQERGFLLKLASPVALQTGMCSGLSIQSRSASGNRLDLRAPAQLWVHPAGKAVPDQYRVRQSLDWIRRAREADEDQNYTLALRFVDSSIQEDSWNPQALFLGGRSASALGDLAQAGSYLAQAIQLGTPDEPTLLLYGKVFEKLGRAPTALDTYRAVLKSGVQPSPAIRLQMARLLSSAGKNEEASAIYADLLSAGKGDDIAHAEYGRVLWRLGKAAPAREQFERALVGNPNSIPALLYFSEAEVAQGNLSQAAELGLRAVQGSPKDPEVQAHMGRVQAAQGDWNSASGYYRTAIALAPNRRELVDLLIGALVHEGKESEAKEILTRVIDSDPSDVAAFGSLAKIQAHSGEISAAVSTLEKGAAHSSEEAHVLYREAAELRERRGEYGQALLDYRAMLRSSPPEVARAERNNLSHHLSFLSRLLSPGNFFGSSTDKKGAPGTEGTDPARAENASSAATRDRIEIAGMLAPGGLSILARTLGIDLAILKERDAAEKIFSYMLEIAPSHSERLQDNPIRRDVAAYLRQYDSLLAHLRKRGLLPPNFDPAKGHEFRFSLLAGGEEQKKTRQFLSFFGVGFRSEQGKDGNYRVELNLKQNKGAAERQQFLRNLGVNLLDRNVREIRFSIRDDELPILFDSRTWTERILVNEKSRSKYLLGRLVLSARAMRLYVALAGCAVSTRDALIKATAPGELLNAVDTVAMYGRYMEFQDGALLLPGSRQAWEALIGAPAGESAKFIPALLRKDEGRALLLYYALSVAPRSVQKVLADNYNLNELYQMLPAYYEARARNGSGAGRHDLGRILQQLTADDQGLVMRIDQRFGKYLVAGAGPQEKGTAGGAGPVRLPAKYLMQLASQESSRKAGARDSVVETLEFVRYLQSSYPEMLHEEAIDAIMRDPWQSPLLLDLVWDLHLPADLLVKYLGYCKERVRTGPRGWNVNRTRTSQALLHILALLHRQEAVKREEAVGLLASALTQLASDEEGVFAQQVAVFLSDQLLPVLEASFADPSGSVDVLLRALAGPVRTQEFAFDGRPLQFDPAQYKLQRMKGAIQQQRYTSLSVLLRIYKLLRELKSNMAAGPAVIEDLKKALAEVQTADLKPDTPSIMREAVAAIDLASLSSKIEASQRSSKGKSSSGFAQLASEIAAALHTELGITLLTYCYAYHGAAETDALAFDPNFVRKHQFYDASLQKDGAWVQARLEQREGTGAYVAGSISGLGFELCNLETAQTAQSFGRREGKALVPTILTGIRAMRRSLRSDRAQEYVALSVRLGREVLALSEVSPEVKQWCESFLGNLVPPKRRERALRVSDEGNASIADDDLSPSELYFLGEGYLNSAALHNSTMRADALPPLIENDLSASRGHPAAADSALSASSGNGASHEFSPEDETSDPDCPVVRRLREIPPKRDSPAAGGFRQEVQQYGVLLRKRLGLNQLSLSMADSYEQLEVSAREEVLFERLCDLKIRLAEINHALGLPASLGEVVGELAIRDILPRSTAIRTNSWKLVLEQIGRLDTDNARNWIEELLNRGILTLASKGAGEK